MSTSTKRSKRNVIFGRKPRFIANGEEARDSRHDFEPANIRVAGVHATSSRANIPG